MLNEKKIIRVFIERKQNINNEKRNKNYKQAS